MSRFRPLLMLLATAGGATFATAQTIYVDESATGPVFDGTSWCTAYQTLDPALAAAAPGTKILVAGGLYTPDPGFLADPRAATFHLPAGVKIEGAYAGCGAPNPNARDYANDISFIRGEPLRDGVTFSYHVLTADHVGDFIMDGLYIDAGHADNNAVTDGLVGAGMLSINSSFSCNNVIFQGNEATDGPDGTYGKGGSIYMRESKAEFTGCLFRESIAGEAGGGIYLEASSIIDHSSLYAAGITANSGGGLFIDKKSTAHLLGTRFLACYAGNYAGHGRGGCVYNGGILTGVRAAFTGNGAQDEGGGVYNGKATADLVNCTFYFQYAGVGGHLYNYGSAVSMMNCLLYDGNAMTGAGGAIQNVASKLSIINCTIADNAAQTNAAGVNVVGSGGGCSIYNSILWHNAVGGVMNEAAQVQVVPTTSLAVNYTDVEGLTGALGGAGNIGADPHFASPGVDYHLQLGSPCVNTGRNGVIPADIADLDGDLNITEQTPYDLDDTARIKGRRVDMGVYEQPMITLGAIDDSVGSGG